MSTHAIRMQSVDDALAEAIAHAVDTRQWTLAHRLVDQAYRLEQRSDKLTLAIARVLAARGQYEPSLALLDAITPQHPPSGLVRAQVLMALGRTTEAHAQLVSMPRSSEMSPQQVRLLGLLDSEEGRTDDAIASLNELVRGSSDPLTLQCLLLIHIKRHDAQGVATTVARLRQCLIYPHLRDHLEIFLGSLRLSVDRAGTAPTARQNTVRELASALAESRSLLPALLYSQRVQHDAASARLLTQSLMMLVEKPDADAELFAAIIELVLRLDGSIAARVWLTRARDAHPLSTTLARMEEMLAAAESGVIDPADNDDPAHQVIATIGPHDTDIARGEAA